jgi:hypothetical protein
MIKSRKMRWAQQEWEGEHIYVISGKAGRKERPLGRLRYRWVDNIKMDHGEIGWGGVDWIGLVQDRDKCEGSCECGNEP